jgi:hypothetical protein
MCHNLYSIDASFHRSSVSLGIVSMARLGLSKRVASSPCWRGLYRMYTTADLTSWVDLCITPYANLYQDRDLYCEGCPVGPFLDYTNLVRSKAQVCARHVFSTRF